MSATAAIQPALHSVQGNLLSSKARNYGYFPLIKGNTVPSFFLRNEDGIAKHFASPLSHDLVISLQDFLDSQQPLVLVFYGSDNHTHNRLNALIQLHEQVQASGGRLLVLTNTPAQFLKRAVRYENKLTIFHDRNNEIAALFGLYNCENPLWQWVSGIESDDVALPAFYVITPDRQIAYHHIDYYFTSFNNKDFTQQPFVNALLASVYEVYQQFSYQPVAYKSVS